MVADILGSSTRSFWNGLGDPGLRNLPNLLQGGP